MAQATRRGVVMGNIQGINFGVNRVDFRVISEIVKRAEGMGLVTKNYDRMTAMMDIEACHLNGCLLDLEKLRDFDNFNFAHDICGIARHMDRNTGKLTDCFVPRCAAPATKEGN